VAELIELPSGDHVSAIPDPSRGRLVFHGVFVPRRIPTSGEPFALCCKDDHETAAEALECAKTTAALLPIRIEPPAELAAPSAEEGVTA
jgi:hypothetical protein